MAKAVRPSIEVIGVQSEAAPAAYRSWKARSLVEDTTGTFAEGLATRTAFALPQRILWQLLDDFVLVSEEALKAATRLMIEKTRNLVEPAGAAALAAVLDVPERYAGRTVALICSGGNIIPAAELLTRRLVEVELHHCDLGVGYGPADWPTAFATLELAEPMRSQRQDRLRYPSPSPGAKPRFPAQPLAPWKPGQRLPGSWLGSAAD